MVQLSYLNHIDLNGLYLQFIGYGAIELSYNIGHLIFLHNAKLTQYD